MRFFVLPVTVGVTATIITVMSSAPVRSHSTDPGMPLPVSAHDAHAPAPSSSNKFPVEHSETHHHRQKLVPNGEPVPSVELVVHPDALRGWNLEIKATHFTFAPDQINTDSPWNQGHAHLYIDGKKLTRLYGSWFYLESLPPGTHEIQVTLNTNQHEDLVYQGKVLGDRKTIVVKP